jgi:hypothetical protein
VLWKLEALKGLPFTTFDTLEHGESGADLIAHFRENMESNPERFATVEAEYVFTNYKAHGHNPSQMPIVICWDVSKNRKIKLKDTNIAWKFIAEAEETNVRVYVLSRMPNLQVGRSK